MTFSDTLHVVISDEEVKTTNSLAISILISPLRDYSQIDDGNRVPDEPGQDSGRNPCRPEKRKASRVKPGLSVWDRGRRANACIIAQGIMKEQKNRF